MTNSNFQVNGKSTIKEEYAPVSGIDLKEINFKTIESKFQENLYLSEEILNIYGVARGFNFQNARTSGFILANSL